MCSKKRETTVSLQEFSRYSTYECIKTALLGEKADIETFVITEGKRTQTAL